MDNAKTMISADQLRSSLDPKSLGVESTAELDTLDGLIGQQRALSALQFGLGMTKAGYNIYVAGEPGLGKMTAVRAYLERMAAAQTAARDWCYVNNFTDPSQPLALALPAGRARVIQRDVKRLVERARVEIPKAFEAEDYAAQRDALGKALDNRRNELLADLRGRAREFGVMLQMAPYGIVTLPLRNGEPIAEDVFETLPKSEQNELRKRNEAFQEHVRATMKAGRELDRQMLEQVAALNKKVAQYVVGGLVDDLCDDYADLPPVVEHLRRVQADMLDNIELFQHGAAPAEASASLEQAAPAWMRDLPLRKYQVNTLVDADVRPGAPVVVELNATYANLFGRVERESQFGALYTDFTLIKPGALHRANGGYLVLSIEDLLRQTLAWEGLKRALRTGEIRIEDIGEQLGFVSTRMIRPQPVPFKAKVILVGRAYYYHVLCAYDEDFAELFKVKADFDTSAPRDAATVRDYLRFVRTLCGHEQLRRMTPAAAALFIEHASRLAEDQHRVSTRFGLLSDLVREANHWAAQAGADDIQVEHMRQALEQRVYRASLVQERLQDMIARGQLLIDVHGDTIGQINGLAVVDIGDAVFGKPSRITASVEPGRAGIVDIEREVALGGPLHSKGVLILSGYLAHRFGAERPIALAARLVFEQSYAGVDGDSASSAELYVLLSALSQLPLRQGVAVTGSVNQLGEVQAIGGVNEKIEGFFDVCRELGLDGRQGVLIPASNAQNLMLREDVVAAVRAGQFNIWGVSTIDEGIEVLTGVPAGARQPNGKFPRDSVNARVDARLRDLARQLREAAGPEHDRRTRGITLEGVRVPN